MLPGVIDVQSVDDEVASETYAHCEIQTDEVFVFSCHNLNDNDSEEPLAL